MKHAKIVLVAEWGGWCGACGTDRPLVLTRTGRQRWRTWLTGAADDSRPLLLTCRLCGTGVAVPLEQDDPPVVITPEHREHADPTPTVPAAAPVVSSDAATVEERSPVPSADLTAGRQVVAQALSALVAQRTAAAAPAALPTVAPLLPLQRTPSSGGLAELQLLADGIDLLSTGRA